MIKNLILPDYKYIRNDINEISTGMPLHHSILTGIAMGDAKTHTAYKRANVSKEVGDKAVEELCNSGIIQRVKSKKVFTSWEEDKKEKISSKLYFNSPFLRFWFAFISPLFQGIKAGKYDEIEERFTNRELELTQLIFTQLCHELLKISYVDDPIVECSSFWNQNVELDIYATTKSKKLIVGSCKYTNQKIKKSELSKLKQNASEAKIDADDFIIFSKKGFSSELKSLKGENLKLIPLKNFQKLVAS